MSCAGVQKAQEADLHRLAGALLDYETLSTAEIRQVSWICAPRHARSPADMTLLSWAACATGTLPTCPHI